MVISEAMSWGIPILSTNIAGIPEMFVDGLEGFLFSPGDNKTAIKAMRELVEDPAKSRVMGIAGIARFASTFDLGKDQNTNFTIISY
jgi:glycosyltransferase involved in cell wall biosynthesis